MNTQEFLSRYPKEAGVVRLSVDERVQQWMAGKTVVERQLIEPIWRAAQRSNNRPFHKLALVAMLVLIPLLLLHWVLFLIAAAVLICRLCYLMGERTQAWSDIQIQRMDNHRADELTEELQRLIVNAIRPDKHEDDIKADWNMGQWELPTAIKAQRAIERHQIA